MWTTGNPQLPFAVDFSKHFSSGADYISKFGYNATVGTSEEPIWAESGVAYTYPSTAQTMTLSCANANDTSAGTGVRSVYIEGLDANYAVVSETKATNGQTAVTLTNQYLRVYRCYAVTAGSGGKNAGIIYIGYGNVTTGKPATVQASIAAGANQTLQALYTVPAGKTGYITDIGIRSNGKGEVRLYTRQQNGLFRIQRNIVITDSVDRTFSIALKYPEKTDIEFRGLADSGTNKMSADFVMVLE